MISDDARASMMYDAHKKTVLVAYLLWFFLGMFSVHRFYLRHNLSAVIQMALGILGPLYMIGGLGLVFEGTAEAGWLETMGIGTLAFGVWLIWIFVDAILIPRLVRECNETIVNQLTGQPLASGPGFESTVVTRTTSVPYPVSVIGVSLALLAVAGAAAYFSKTNNGGEGLAPTSGDQSDKIAGPSDEAGQTNEIEPTTEPESQSYSDVSQDTSVAKNDSPAGPVAQQIEPSASFDFNTAAVQTAKQRALEKGKAVRWTSEAGSGFAVPSSVTDVEGTKCRTVYVTFAGNGGEERKSAPETLCRETSGNWEPTG